MSQTPKNPEWLARFQVAHQAAVDNAMKVLAETAASTARLSMGTNHGGVPSAPGQPPHTQHTGDLRRTTVSAGPALMGRPGVSSFGSNVTYGRILELGGTITAKGKMLTIPLNRQAALKSGRPGWNPHTEPGLFLLKRKGRAPLLVKSKGGGKSGNGKGARIELWFALVPRVKIAARPFLRPAARSAITKTGRIEAAYNNGFRAAWGHA